MKIILETQEKTNLSAGQLQKLGIARALVEKEKVLILDEILANLDEKSEKSISNLLKELDMTIIVISHRLGNLSEFMKVYKIENKNLVEVRN
ncbi:ATP-binding cassette domain-containing protein [Gemella palaticanis]|uniref:ATP-binding cassette domain-containing protein n=1 Tax=Gemelliphila palaticanis TaxID=81950 RepID=A0ABX2SXS5_9BACL|nr:ATP-binding cassette domain-containing protein [Gemella palaticanis]NYS46939.1 ATP-binding cassette domain-containing protein [Gemella palaticanis]